MVFFLTRRWNTKVLRLSIFVMLGTLFIGEFLVFVITAFAWNIPESRSKDSLKVLLLSDPQIQGFQFEAQGIVGHIARWDACHYLKKTFFLAMIAVQPDVVIILGDLLDEGYVSSNDTFLLYKDWFEDIYKVPNTVRKIHLAGDNDVGGEAEPLDLGFLSRHEKYFGPTNEIIKFKSWQFLKLNTLSFLRFYQHTTLDEKHIFDDLKKFTFSSLRKLDTSKHTVVLSHLPVFHWDSHFAVQILTSFSPRAIFTGHVHKESYRAYKLNSFMTEEHTVPTCSYRMGSLNMGMGVAIFDKDGSFQYSVLRLPVRYSFLYLYLVVFILCLLCSLVFGRS